MNSGDQLCAGDSGSADIFVQSRKSCFCPTCGAPRSADSIGEFCPVCMLRCALTSESDPDEYASFASEDSALNQRLGHYELAKSKDGKPVELGRGAMGVTYKGIDVDLRCPVALKVISEGRLNDESVQLRFLREARAAASLRHPNVASVFHLGKIGDNYFYAMEFVDGETLESLIRRSGRLEVKLALTIAAQVTAGLAAIYKQKLVHRDIKPSNIMVSFEEEDAVIAKIIDLGLAKDVNELGSSISTHGGFAGTPEFASPEQFAGVCTDIRSDLYSLGATLWTMLTGRSIFAGSPAEVMHQHLYAQLPLKQLQGVPQPVVVLLEKLLEKNPARRLQNPSELLNAILLISSAIQAGRKISRQKFQTAGPANSIVKGRKALARLGPEKISISKLPVTGSDVFGREEELAILDEAWASQSVNVVTIVAWAGVGKSTLVNHWLRRIGAGHGRSAEVVFGWSFYRQSASGQSISADEFLDSALTWFEDPDPRIGTAWEKGERLAKLIAKRRTLLILDGVEPLQNPPGPQEGRLREPSLQALVRELAAFNKGLCVITTRLPIADIAHFEPTSALRLELEQLSSEAGARLLVALGVKGREEELRTASNEFNGHCLALTLLGSYLTDAYNGDIRCRKEPSERLAHDVRQGAHARRVMESYQTWFGEGPELSLLRILGLFDRPLDEKTLEALLKGPPICGLTESLIELSPAEWRTLLAKLRRAKLLFAQDFHNPGYLDTHPLVREHFGGQLRNQQPDAWKESNRRLFHYYRESAPQLPETFTEMEPLFLAVICGCNAGLYREALHEVFIPRIQRGDASFAADVLEARGALLSVLSHFFEHGRWGSPAQMGFDCQSLTAEDQLFILTQAARYLTMMRGFAVPEARVCHERAEAFCHSLNRPLLQHAALMGQWRYSLITDKLTKAMQIAKRIEAFSQEQNDAALRLGACRTLACTQYYSGDFSGARLSANCGLQIWRSGNVKSKVQEVDPPVIACLTDRAQSEWHLGEVEACQATMAEAIATAKQLNENHGIAEALYFACCLAHYLRKPDEVNRLATDLVELSTRQNFALWLARGTILRGWARSALGDTAQGIQWIEIGIRDWRLTGATLCLPFCLALKAEALYHADQPHEALAAILEAEALVEKNEETWWSPEIRRLHAVFLVATGASESEIELAFQKAISIAQQQKSVSLAQRAESTYTEYCVLKERGAESSAFLLPVC